MKSEELIAEGRKLSRPSVLLKPHGKGPIAARWYERDKAESRETGERCWLTVDCSFIPGLSMTGYLNFYSNEINLRNGRVEHLAAWPEREGLPLIAHPTLGLPPINAVFLRGSDAVGDWLGSYGWDRKSPYNRNFKGRQVAEEYNRIWMSEFPLYSNLDLVFAMLGGWHFPWPDGDWLNLIDEQLLVMTFEDSEPWIEAWKMRNGDFKVIQRIT